MEHRKRRYSFQCLSPECGRNQTRWVRRGLYVTCRHCGSRNPGPEVLRRLFPMVAPPAELACSA